MTDIQNCLATATQQLRSVTDSAILDAEILLCHALNKPRSHLRAWPEKQLQSAEYTQFLSLLDQRLQGLPIAYITGHREFWSREFKVSSHVLIPRPDTELLIELSLTLLKHQPNSQIIDLGTGSGIIAITLAAEIPSCSITATDISEEALQIARENAQAHQTGQIHFVHSNWFEKINPQLFNLVISNPPYIARDDIHLSQGDVRFEPASALISKDQGLKDITTIACQATQFLTANGTLLIEHGYNQKNEVQHIFKSLTYSKVTTYNDLAGNPRVTSGVWNP